jgi:hypothetical protein
MVGGTCAVRVFNDGVMRHCAAMAADRASSSFEALPE